MKERTERGAGKAERPYDDVFKDHVRATMELADHSLTPPLAAESMRKVLRVILEELRQEACEFPSELDLHEV